MSAEDQGEVIINKIVVPAIKQAKLMKNNDAFDTQDFGDDASRFGVGTLASIPAKEVNSHLRTRTSNRSRMQWSNWATENG